MIRKILLIFTLFFCSAIGDKSAIVKISNGKLQGTFNGDYYSFKGIPYAEPPVGDNRFESPKPFTEKWDDIRDATKTGETCARLDPIIIAHQQIFAGSEDCLFVNVYTPKINTEQLLPVVFFIHGGGYMFGSGDFVEEKLLMKTENFVYVTFNYRLGLLGFMSTEDDEITGNMGLKDQRLALEWVHDNIKAFGGDPEQVLMAGFSAGGASVEIQLLQPGVEKLVKAAWSLSGSAMCPWATKKNVLNDVKIVAKSLKCPNIESTVEIKKCFKEATVEDIVNSSKLFFLYNYHPVVIWGPSVESSNSKDAMLLETPEELIKKGKFANIPYLTSYTSQDGAFVNAELMYQKEDGTTDLEYFNNNYKELLPVMIFYKQRFNDKTELDEYTEKLYKDAGIVDGKITMENFDKLTKITTEETMRGSIRKSWEFHKKYSPSKVYGYEYDYPAAFGIGNAMANRTDISFGCNHGDDVFLMFNFALRKIENFNEVEQKHSKEFLDLLYKFAITGVPKFGDTEFPENNSDDFKYLHITEKNADIEQLK